METDSMVLEPVDGANTDQQINDLFDTDMIDLCNWARLSCFHARRQGASPVCAYFTAPARLRLPYEP